MTHDTMEKHYHKVIKNEKIRREETISKIF